MGYLRKEAKSKIKVLDTMLDKLRRVKELYAEGAAELDPNTGAEREGISAVYSGINNLYKHLDLAAQDAVITGAKATLPLGGLAYIGGSTGLGALASTTTAAGGAYGGSRIGHLLADSIGEHKPVRGRKGSLLRGLLSVTGAASGGGTGLLAAHAIKAASHSGLTKEASLADFIGEMAYNKARKEGADINSALQAAGTAQLYTTGGALTGTSFGALTGAALANIGKKITKGRLLLGALTGAVPGAAIGGYGGLALGTNIAKSALNTLPAHIKDLGYRPVLTARDADGNPSVVG